MDEIQDAVNELIPADTRSQNDLTLVAKTTILKMKQLGFPEDEIYIAEMEIYGGNCRGCGMGWVKVHVDNIFAKFDYFEPSCNCVNEKSADAERQMELLIRNH
ncbi:MAG TPA: hypothetical protein VLE21_06660, partial [Candidatus Nitrosocosmicus sp.]|nr:hypothetical protein [Candidatus Nitrosocosmicus sp.]